MRGGILVNQRYLPRIFRQLIEFDNVVGVGTGKKMIRGKQTNQDAIIVLVRKKQAKSNLYRYNLIPNEIDGKPTDVIEVGDIRLFADTNERTKMIRPAVPGISIGHYKISAGTFGAVVKDRESGEMLILSNNHVLANQTDGTDGRAQIGDVVLQPALFDGGNSTEAVIAKLERYVPIYKDTILITCPIAKLVQKLANKMLHIVRPNYHVQLFRESGNVNIVDCAVAKPISSTAISPEILDIGRPVGIKKPQVGMAVKKSGRTTGLTYSIILAVGVTLKIMITEKEYGVFTEQILAGPMSMPGDSGSLILSEDNYAVGLLFAGSEQATMFNNIENVLKELDITF